MKIQSNCRICDTRLPDPYLKLGKTPLANSYIAAAETLNESYYDLEVGFCPNCCLSQLSVVVPEELMFKHYLYVSSTTNTFRAHCKELSISALSSLHENVIPKVLDIGSNDGCLLSYFRENGHQVIGVDPAENLAAEANARGIKTINTFWGTEAADMVLASVGQPTVVTATNVLAHVDQVHNFLSCVDRVLNDAGIFVFEVPYLVDLVQKCEFDTIYHEHLSYFLVKPLSYALESHNFHIIDVQHRPIHGGTIRVFVAKKTSNYEPSGAVRDFLSTEEELGFHDKAIYTSFAHTVDDNKCQMLALVRKILDSGKTIAGYGAAAKGNTLLNYYGIDNKQIKYICDDNPKKHSHLTPGTHIPIVDPAILKTEPCDFLLLLAWNFANEIMERTHDLQKAGGHYILPVPNPCIL